MCSRFFPSPTLSWIFHGTQGQAKQWLHTAVRLLTMWHVARNLLLDCVCHPVSPCHLISFLPLYFLRVLRHCMRQEKRIACLTWSIDAGRLVVVMQAVHRLWGPHAVPSLVKFCCASPHAPPCSRMVPAKPQSDYIPSCQPVSSPLYALKHLDSISYR